MVKIFWAASYDDRDQVNTLSGAFEAEESSTLWAWLASVAPSLDPSDCGYMPSGHELPEVLDESVLLGRVFNELDEDGEQEPQHTALLAYTASPTPTALQALLSSLQSKLSRVSDGATPLTVTPSLLLMGALEDCDGGIYRAVGLSTVGTAESLEGKEEVAGEARGDECVW